MKHITDLDNISSNIFGVASHSTTKDFHSHTVAQLSVPTNGVLYIIVENELFIIPPGMAVFIPKNVLHCVKRINAHTIVETVYFTDTYKEYLPHTTKSVYLSELSKVVISKICTFAKDEFTGKKVINLINVLLDEFNESDMLNYSLKIPTNRTLLKIYELFTNSTDSYPSLVDASKYVCLSTRTLVRLFKHELGVSFVLWKQQFIFIKALELLMLDKSTTVVAYKLGYNSDSAFITMFKKMSGGRLPSSFFSNNINRMLY